MAKHLCGAEKQMGLQLLLQVAEQDQRVDTAIERWLGRNVSYEPHPWVRPRGDVWTDICG